MSKQNNSEVYKVHGDIHILKATSARGESVEYKVLTGSRWEEVATGTVIQVLIGDDVVTADNEESARYVLALQYGRLYTILNLSTGNESVITRSTLLSPQFKKISAP